MNNKLTHDSQRRGFTLIEMLVAMAVFLVLAAIVMQMVFTTTQITQSQKQQMDAMAEARQALDRMKLDWTSRVRRNDVPAEFIKQGGNDQIQLLSQTSSYGGGRTPLAALSYRINTTSLQFERGVVGYNWQGSNQLTFPFVMPAFADANYEVLAKSVFRLEFCFLRVVRDSTTSPYTVDIQNVRESNPQPAYQDSTSLNLGSANLAGLVVAVAVLDEKGRKIVTSAQLTQLSQALPDIAEGETPLSKWTPLINAPNFANGVPRPAAASVHVYQRVFYINE